MKNFKMKKLDRKGFTLIELLAVIVILGLLMAIAIPSVTRYITQSRKKTLVNTIDSFITTVATDVNDNKFGPLTTNGTLYYIPVSNNVDTSCISLEKGGSDPFGDWNNDSYVAVKYNSDTFSYDYYFTFLDSAGFGMKLIKSDEIANNGSDIVQYGSMDSFEDGIEDITHQKLSATGLDEITQIVVLARPDAKTECSVGASGNKTFEVPKGA